MLYGQTKRQTHCHRKKTEKYTQIETLTNIKTKNREIDRKMLNGKTYRLTHCHRKRQKNRETDGETHVIYSQTDKISRI